MNAKQLYSHPDHITYMNKLQSQGHKVYCTTCHKTITYTVYDTDGTIWTSAWTWHDLNTNEE